MTAREHLQAVARRLDGYVYYRCPRLEGFLWNHLYTGQGRYRIARRSHGVLFSCVAFALGLAAGRWWLR